MFAPITAQRLRLRLVTSGDADTLSRLMTPDVSKWVASWPWPFTPTMAADRIAAALAAAERRKALPLAIESRSTNEVLGWFGAAVVESDESRAAIGYWLAEAHHGLGYMREAVPPAIRATFDFLGVEVIEAGMQLGNNPSSAVVRALGMRYVGNRDFFASARQRHELCAFYELHRSELA